MKYCMSVEMLSTTLKFHPLSNFVYHEDLFMEGKSY